MEGNVSLAELEFLAEPDDDLKCLICLGVAREPQQHETCGRLFCRECLEKYGVFKPCPNCREQDSCYYEDKRSRRVIQDLLVKCQNLDRGCDWQGTLASLNAHLATCQFALISCPQYCGEEILRKDSDKHMSNMCPHRMYICLSCGEEGTYSDITGTHDSVCEKKIVACSNPECQQTMQRCKVEEHVKSECDHTIIPCKYENFGCDVKIKRLQMKTHEEDNDKEHLRMAIAISSQFQQKIQKLESSLQEATDSIALLTRKFEEYRGFSQQSVLTKVDDTLRPLKKRVTLLENKVNVFNFNVLYKFTLHQYGKKKRNDKTYTSQPFYTCSDDGYNLAVEIEANGIGDGYGTHVSAYVKVKPGKNDGNIPWPFVGRVTIILLNQLEDKNHHSRTILIEAADNIRVGSSLGCDKFIDHSGLDYCNEKNTLYLSNDMLHFQVCYW